MQRFLNKWKRLLTLSVILGWVLLAAGCSTTALEYSGQMPNEKASKHVQGFQQKGNGSRVLPVAPITIR